MSRTIISLLSIEDGLESEAVGGESIASSMGAYAKHTSGNNSSREVQHTVFNLKS